MKLVVRHDGETIDVTVERAGSGYRVLLGQKEFFADVISINSLLRSLRLEDHRQFLIGHHAEGPKHWISFGDQSVAVEVFDPLTLKRGRRDDEAMGASGAVRALMPGRVVRLMVEEGAVVQKGKGLLILEAMKMENEITAPADGTVVKIHVNAGDTVEGGAELLSIE